MRRSHIIISVISFLAGLLVYDVFIVDLYLATKESPNTNQVAEVECPGEQFLYETGMIWSDNFWSANPNATDEQWTEAWNSMISDTGCDEYQVSIEDVYYSGLLSDLIYASSTDVAVCPTEDELSGVYEHWYNYFMRGSATSTDEAALEGWNGLMVRNGCTALVNPFNL